MGKKKRKKKKNYKRSNAIRVIINPDGSRNKSNLFIIKEKKVKEIALKSKRGRNYQQRNENLKLLGFDNYRQYLRSSKWKRIRKEVFLLKGKRCTGCGNLATAIHHTRYNISTLKGLNLTHLHPICNSCHNKIEFDNGDKLSLKQSNKKFTEWKSETDFILNKFIDNHLNCDIDHIYYKHSYVD